MVGAVASAGAGRRNIVEVEGRAVDLALLRTFLTVHRAGSFTRPPLCQDSPIRP